MTRPSTSSSASAPHTVREDLGYSRTVSYDCRNHWAVISQRWGSITTKVMPFCVVNTVISLALIVLLEVYGIDLTISEFGHEFMSILVSFLVITKLSYTIDLYYELQGHLANMNQATIEITQLACAFTRQHTGDAYKKWRYEVTYHALVLVMSTCAIIHKSGDNNVWEEVNFKRPGRGLLLHLPEEASHRKFAPGSGDGPRIEYPKEMYVMGHNLRSDLNLRVPIRVAQRTRDAIMDHVNLTQPLRDCQEWQLLDRVKDFMNSYRGIRKYLVAPLPLPWVQLGRLFTFAYVFSLPFALLSTDLNLQGAQVVFLTFIMTYGFVGCELLFVELDDPFAEDPNDLPLAEETRAAVEDAIISLYYVDGKDSAVQLKDEIPIFGGDDFYDKQVEKHRPVFPLNKGSKTQGKETDPLVSS